MRKRITKKDILGAIESYQFTHMTSPSLRELQNILGVKSVNTIFRHVKALEEKKIIEKNSRGIIKLTKRLSNRVESLRLFERLPAYEPRKAYHSLSKHMDMAEFFRVKGNQWIGFGIGKNDFLALIPYYLVSSFEPQNYILIEHNNKKEIVFVKNDMGYDSEKRTYKVQIQAGRFVDKKGRFKYSLVRRNKTYKPIAILVGVIRDYYRQREELSV
jgi:hypothetical protein